MRILPPVGFLLFLASSTLPGQTPPPLDQLATRLAAMTAVSGYERSLTDSLLTLVPGSIRDRAGNVVLALGSGEPRRLFACGVDEPGYVVGGLRGDGYLTLRRVGRSPGPLADQQLEGQRVTLWGRRGPVPGVVAVRSIHLTNGRGPLPDAPFSVDEAIVDVGADDSVTVHGLGLSALAPVTLTKITVRYADSLLAAPAAARRTACAVLARAAVQTHPGQGSVVVAFLVEQLFTRRGLLTLARERGPFTSVVMLDGGPGPDRVGSTRSPDPELLKGYETLVLPGRYFGTAVESVSLVEASALEMALVRRIEGEP